MPVCEVDLRPGGAWRYVLRGPAGEEMAIRGEFIEVAPPEHIVTTEAFEGAEFEPMGGGTVNTMLLEERQGRTLLTITAVYKSRAARDSALRTGMDEGAAETFERLQEYLEEMA